MPEKQVRQVLIFRLGSIGDFVVALPCLHLIRARYPKAEIGLLTKGPIDSRAVPAMAVLDGTKLIDRQMTYPIGGNDLNTLRAIARAIKSFKPDVFVYLVEREARSFAVLRDYLFFRCCGIGNSVGFPLRRDLRAVRRPTSPDGLWEREANRLARCLAVLGDAEPERPASWDLRLSASEIEEADRFISEGTSASPNGLRLLGLSIGTKQAIKDWGDSNWQAALMSMNLRDHGIVLIGAAEERVRSEEVAKGWPGPVLNFCGLLSPRVSAAVLRRVELFLCHDSGPMHLAAAVGTRCVAVFSKKDPPGKWYPFGVDHIILRPPKTADSIRAIRPSEVSAAVARALAERPHSAFDEAKPKGRISAA